MRHSTSEQRFSGRNRCFSDRGDMVFLVLLVSFFVGDVLERCTVLAPRFGCTVLYQKDLFPVFGASVCQTLEEKWILPVENVRCVFPKVYERKNNVTESMVT